MNFINLHGFASSFLFFLQGSFANKAEQIMKDAGIATLEMEMDYDAAAALVVKRVVESKRKG
jgi:hypothetical protein